MCGFVDSTILDGKLRLAFKIDEGRRLAISGIRINGNKSISDREVVSAMTIKPEGLRRDVASFFSLPIPLLVWERLKIAQNDRFVAYVEACRNWK